MSNVILCPTRKSNDVTLYPIKGKVTTLVDKSEYIVYIPRADRQTYGSVRIGEGLLIDNGIVSFDRNEVPILQIAKNGTIIHPNKDKIVDIKLYKGDVGLDRVDNTSDLDKPISKLQQEALDKKYDKYHGVENAGKYLKIDEEGYVELIDYRAIKVTHNDKIVENDLQVLDFDSYFDVYSTRGNAKIELSKDFVRRVDLLEDRISGKDQALTFEDYQHLIDVFNIAPNDLYSIGRDVLVVKTGVPDLWISDIEVDSIQYEYSDDEAIIDTLDKTGKIQIGYYVFSQLETGKIDLTNYVTTDTAQDINADKNFNCEVLIKPSDNGRIHFTENYLELKYSQPDYITTVFLHGHDFTVQHDVIKDNISNVIAVDDSGVELRSVDASDFVSNKITVNKEGINVDTIKGKLFKYNGSEVAVKNDFNNVMLKTGDTDRPSYNNKELALLNDLNSISIPKPQYKIIAYKYTDIGSIGTVYTLTKTHITPTNPVVAVGDYVQFRTEKASYTAYVNSVNNGDNEVTATVRFAGALPETIVPKSDFNGMTRWNTIVGEVTPRFIDLSPTYKQYYLGLNTTSMYYDASGEKRDSTSVVTNSLAKFSKEHFKVQTSGGDSDTVGTLYVNTDNIATKDDIDKVASDINLLEGQVITKAEERFAQSLKATGTAIPANSNLDTVEFFKVGTYYCNSNVNASTLINSPTSVAFMMTVSSPISTNVDNEMSSTYVRRIREITTYDGEKYIQCVFSSNDVGAFSARTWAKIEDSAVIYDMSSISSDLNLGLTSGIVGGKSVVLDMTIFRKLRIYINSYDNHQTFELDLKQSTKRISNNDYPYSATIAGSAIGNTAEIHYCACDVNTARKTFVHRNIGYIKGTTVYDRNDSTDYVVYKIEGIY